MSPRHTDTDQGWVKREHRRIWKAIRESNSAKRLQAATIGRGGLTVKDGGSVKIKDGGGVEVTDGGDLDIRDGGGVRVRDGGQMIATWPNGDTAAYFGPLVGANGPDWRGYSVQDENSKSVFTAARLPPGFDPTYPDGVSGHWVGESSQPVDYDITRTTDWLVVADGEAWLQFPRTTSASANMYVDGPTGNLARSTSSRRYKQDFEDVHIDPDAVLQLRAQTWRDRSDVEANPDSDRRYIGFLAEDLDELGLTDFVTYDAEGQPDAIAYDRLTVAVLAVVRRQQQQIDNLTATVTELREA